MAADAVDLMRAILGHGTTEVEAHDARNEALEREADPMLWACLYHGISQAEAMRRAAEWADLAFFDKVPELPPSETATPRLEMLAEVRMCRLKVIDKDVAFAAPDFFGILRLRQARLADPSIRNRVCLVPPGSLRSYLVSNSEAALIDGARQTLARFWPYAAAQLDLVLPLRWLFAAGLLALSFGLMLAPLTGHLWLLPIWMVIMLLPTVMRFAALLVPAQLRPTTPREADGACRFIRSWCRCATKPIWSTS
ncbi:hypothetical protein [Devosia rhizoryzae]|uniref:Uncharacterized protein n=1 Tax=Devosia rhizoryzae TaxID=2774137 RepID=A0ABX7C393_9HYPH|nr:hypothetical protein [Devosia rhizoryzae]QQR38678.1 hypothetical protein JI748_13010 [Devosia rhizoryzae]